MAVTKAVSSHGFTSKSPLCHYMSRPAALARRDGKKQKTLKNSEESAWNIEEMNWNAIIKVPNLQTRRSFDEKNNYRISAASWPEPCSGPVGLRGKAEYRQHFYGEDEATAQKAIAAIQQESVAADILQGVLTGGNQQKQQDNGKGQKSGLSHSKTK